MILFLLTASVVCGGIAYGQIPAFRSAIHNISEDFVKGLQVVPGQRPRMISRIYNTFMGKKCASVKEIPHTPTLHVEPYNPVADHDPVYARHRQISEADRRFVHRDGVYSSMGTNGSRKEFELFTITSLQSDARSLVIGVDHGGDKHCVVEETSELLFHLPVQQYRRQDSPPTYRCEILDTGTELDGRTWPTTLLSEPVADPSAFRLWTGMDSTTRHAIVEEFNAKRYLHGHRRHGRGCQEAACPQMILLLS